MQKEFGDQDEEKEGKTYVAGVILVVTANGSFDFLRSFIIYYPARFISIGVSVLNGSHVAFI